MEPKYPASRPEIWGGIECTINRVNNVYRDQLDYSGHYIRTGDIERFAELGIAKIRYPVLWEHHQPDEWGEIDWHWITCQLESLRKNNITPVAGLLHHGSGPTHTDLLDPGFPEKLAAYAANVARQFPWLTYYTPVNEPLTTARFSGLYGYWYPHQANEQSFARMLLIQVKGIILSMEAIRKINPSAKLVQTEDLSKAHSSALLSYQADFENHRRWLTYDLLCGKFDDKHFFWNYFISIGIHENELQFFSGHSCSPDIMGFNYYVTSERWLDEKLELYPLYTHGGNGRHRYADTEAVQKGKMEGLERLLTEAWERYRLPMAVTECHINCSREEQLRWLKQTWTVCMNLHQKRIPVKAVTAWSLLGSRDWDSLLVAEHNHYETGVYDVRLGNLRPTALAKMMSSLAKTGDFKHPLADSAGWWQPGEKDITSIPPVIISGGGNITSALLKSCKTRGINCIVTDQAGAGFLSSIHTPWAVIDVHDDRLHCTGGLVVVHENDNDTFIANEALNLLIDGENGVWQITGGGVVKKMTPAARMAFEIAG